MVCHSLACVLWLHHVAAGGAPAERVLLVAPPSPGGVPEMLQASSPCPVAGAAQRAARSCSDNDPYCPEGADTLYSRACRRCCPAQGHINPDAGYGPWPAVEAWARDGTVPVTAR